MKDTTRSLKFVEFETTESMTEYNNIRDTIEEIIFSNIIREDELRNLSKDVLNGDILHNRS